MGKIKRKLDKKRTRGLIQASIRHEGDFSSSSFIEGFDFGIDAIVVVLKDKRNKYNAWLAQERVHKLGKTANFERIVSYTAHIEMIDELLKDLK